VALARRRSAQANHACRSRPGGNRSQIARRGVMSAARRIAFSSTGASVVQTTADVTTQFRVRVAIETLSPSIPVVNRTQ
jgi:hypothetical protein